MKAVFLDKDGTLLKNVPYNVDPDLIELELGAVEALQVMQDLHFKLILVSNQSGLARGFFTEKDLSMAMERVHRLLADSGISLFDIYFCPHHTEGEVKAYTKSCFCRKPRPGMLFQAREDHNIILNESWMIGDILNDVEAGNRAGCRTILVDNGGETEWELTDLRRPDIIVDDLLSAAQAIAAIEKLQSFETRQHAENIYNDQIKEQK